MKELTQDYLKSRIEYDPAMGCFTWLKSGKKAGWVESHGYLRISVDRKKYRAHRLAWFYMFGKWPELEIDHIDNDKLNNRWCNLREVTPAQNSQNRKRKPKGYFWNKQRDKFEARIMKGGKIYRLGFFSSEAEAGAAYQAAVEVMHFR